MLLNRQILARMKSICTTFNSLNTVYNTEEQTENKNQLFSGPMCHEGMKISFNNYLKLKQFYYMGTKFLNRWVTCNCN
jgi:hypothetical protein